MQLHGTGGAWIPRFHLCWENGHSSRLLCQRTPVHTKAVIPSSHLFKIRLMNIGTNVYQVCTYVLFRAWELQTVQSCGLMVSWNGQVCKRGRIGSSRDIDHVQNEPWHSWLDQRSVLAIFCNHIVFLGAFSKHFVYECAIVIFFFFVNILCQNIWVLGCSGCYIEEEWECVQGSDLEVQCEGPGDEPHAPPYNNQFAENCAILHEQVNLLINLDIWWSQRRVIDENVKGKVIVPIQSLILIVHLCLSGV